MTTFTVFAFGEGQGERAWRRLEVSSQHPLPVDDAAAVDWPRSEVRPTAWQIGPPGDRRRMLSGAFWGMLFAHLFLIPLSRDESPGPAPAEADHSLGLLGISPDQLVALRGPIAPGVSALFVLHDHGQADAVTTTFGAGRDPVAALCLTPLEARRLYAGFGVTGPDD
jgi:uncharacterized membrane protein